MCREKREVDENDIESFEDYEEYYGLEDNSDDIEELDFEKSDLPVLADDIDIEIEKEDI